MRQLSQHGRDQVMAAFASIFEYPGQDLATRAKRCASLLQDNRASSMADSFASYCERHSLEHLQEVYTRTFDLQPSCFPYVGYQLFGESYKRGDFLARLKGRYIECGFQLGNEIPDHIAVLLRFLSQLEDGEESADLARFCLVPAIEKMIHSIAGGRNPYGDALRALAIAVSQTFCGLEA